MNKGVELNIDDLKVAIDYEASSGMWVCSICKHRVKFGGSMVAHVVMHHTGIKEFADYFREYDQSKNKTKITLGKTKE